MTTEEAEALIQASLYAVSEQYIMPLALAVGTLTAVVCRDRQVAEQVAKALSNQAQSCLPDVAGRALLESLAALAGRPEPPTPSDVQTTLHRGLRLIQGGKPS